MLTISECAEIRGFPIKACPKSDDLGQGSRAPAPGSDPIQGALEPLLRVEQGLGQALGELVEQFGMKLELFLPLIAIHRGDAVEGFA